MQAMRAPTDGERMIEVVEEVRELRKQVAALRHEQQVADRYMSLIEGFLAVAEGQHLRQQVLSADMPVRDRDHDLDQLLEIAKAMDVEDRLKKESAPEGTDGGGP